AHLREPRGQRRRHHAARRLFAPRRHRAGRAAQYGEGDAMKRPRGFSLVELMAVVALVGVIASLAVMSIKRSRSSDDADKWANLLRNTVNQVRRRAISTGSTYMIDLRANPNRLQWCQVVDTIGSCTTTTTTCPNSGTGMEN